MCSNITYDTLTVGYSDCTLTTDYVYKWDDCVNYWNPQKPQQTIIIQQNMEENIMYIFDVTIVDKKECELIKNMKVIAETKEAAILEVELTQEQKKKIKKGEIEIIFNEIGTFKKIERKE